MFPDIANVLRIREALWRHKVLGSASIMVGAGFSRNADPLSSSARPMPNWSQMAEALCHPLYPLDDALRTSALREASGTSGFLRLAQEYQAAFGVSSLNDRIRNLVPDTDYRPGDLHKRLLRLPWADVFSTNWDTLLERACTDVFDRSYDIVRTVGEIPFTMRPRIVKLHGSFPGHEPFIFTEEEYRTYPASFSPFVNLVQQSMMETVFCLVGFSGDDPNFLHWSGWVRDNLGHSAPKIYLVGWLELSNHRRRMLEARNVMPVDLSALPEAIKWPADLRHRYATEWFIAALELGKPYTTSYWPRPAAAPPALPAYLGAIPVNAEPLPRDEPHSPPFDKPLADRQQALITATEVWAHNRRLYPGWLIAPESTRRALQQSFYVWQREFALLPALTPLDRLKALSELAWRLNRALLPFPTNHEEIAFSTLATIDRLAQTIDGATISKTENWSEITNGADALALILARNARHSGNRKHFDQALLHLKPHHEHDAERRNAITYEECLWDLAAGNLTSLTSRLDAWIPAQGENLWGLRKAGLLAEIHEDARACALLETTLMQIRRARRRDVDDLTSLSLEGWALFLALAYSHRGFRPTPTLPKDMPEPFERWRALRILDCDAFSDYQVLKHVLEADTPQQTEFTKRRGFDLDQVNMTHHLGRGPAPTLIAAYEMVMLAEITGLPPMVSHMRVIDEGLQAAAKILAVEEPWLASQLVIRLETGNKLLDEVFTRVWIARLPQPPVEMLRNALLKRTAVGLARLETSGAWGRDGVNIVGPALEALSRVAVRLHAQELLALFDEAITHYRSPAFRRLSTQLGEPLAHLMGRVLESLPRTNIINLLPQLFTLPLPQELGATPDTHRWQDPISLLPTWLDESFKGTIVRTPEWDPIISHLLQAAPGPDIINREAAIGRLYRLYQWKVLDQNEAKVFAHSIWIPSQRNSLGLPEHTGLRAWVLLTVPEEHANQARDALVNAIGELAREPSGKLHDRLAEIGELFRHLKRLNISFELSGNAKDDLIKFINVWADHRVQDRFDLFSREYDRVYDALEGISFILPYVARTEELLQKIWNKVDAMDQGSDGDFPGFALYPALALYWPTRTAELIERLRRALLSDQEDRVKAAVSSLFYWVTALDAYPENIKGSLDDLVREVGIGIAARRVAILRPALAFARWIYRKGPEPLRKLVAVDCDHGLAALMEEASYSRSEQTLDVPAVRAACLRLASAMADAGYAGERGVSEWLANAKDDPLPEVRNADHLKQEE